MTGKETSLEGTEGLGWWIGFNPEQAERAELIKDRLDLLQETINKLLARSQQQESLPTTEPITTSVPKQETEYSYPIRVQLQSPDVRWADGPLLFNDNDPAIKRWASNELQNPTN